MNGQAIAIAAAVATVWFIGAETVKGVKWVGKKVDHAIFHRHEKPVPKNK